MKCLRSLYQLLSRTDNKVALSLPPANEVCEVYVFTRVCLSMGVGGIPACLAGGIPACLAGFQDQTRGVLEGSGRGGGSPNPHPGGVSLHALRQAPRLTAIAAGGTHPTGMHSC